MNRTENFLAALAPFLRKNYEGVESDATDPDKLNAEARERVVRATLGLEPKTPAESDHLFELSRVLVDGLHKSFVGLHKHTSGDLIDVEYGDEDGGVPEDIRGSCLKALNGYVLAISSGLNYIMRNKLTSKLFITAFNKLKDFQSVFYLTRIFFMSPDAYILPIIRSWFIEFSPLVSRCNEEYEAILSQKNSSNNQVKPDELKTLLCKLVSYGDYSRAQKLLSAPALFSGVDASLAASVRSLLENYAASLEVLDRLSLNDFYKYLFRWRESCMRLKSETSAKKNVPLTSVLSVLLGEDDNALSESFVGVLLTRILYKRPDSTVYTLPQATSEVLGDFEISDKESFCLVPCEALCGNQDRLLALVKKTGSSWFHGLLADVLCLGSQYCGRDKKGKLDELTSARDASIDEYAGSLMSNLFFVQAINYAKTCRSPQKTAVRRAFLSRVSVGDDRTARKLVAACKGFAPELVSVLHERVGVEKVRRAAYPEAMKHFILSGNVHLISGYALALVTCEVDPSCDFKRSVIATGAVVRRCEYAQLHSEIGYFELLADVYASLADLDAQAYLERLSATLKSPEVPAIAKFRLVRDVALDLEGDRKDEIRGCLTRELAMVLVETLEEVCLSYQSDKIFAMISQDDINSLRLTFSKLFN